MAVAVTCLVVHRVRHTNRVAKLVYRNTLEIDSEVADDFGRSVIQEQVEMGVAVRMSCLDILTRSLRSNTPSIEVTN